MLYRESLLGGIKLYKKRYLLFVAAVPLVVMSGCSIGDRIENKSVAIEKVDMSKYERQTEEGVFKGVLSQSVADIEVNGELKMFKIKASSAKQINDLKPNDTIRFVYSKNQKTGDNEMYTIVALNGKDVHIPKEIENKESKSIDKKNAVNKQKENVKKEKMEVEYPDRTKIKDVIDKEFYGHMFKVIDDYEWDGTKLTNKDTEITITPVKDTIEDDIQKERWRAAGILKKDGSFKERKNIEKKDKFVFYVSSDDKYKEIKVIKNKFGYFRIETTTNLEDKDNVIAEVKAMVETID